MLTPERALGISREVFLTVVDGIDEGHISIDDEAKEAFTLLSNLDIEQAGDGPGQAVLFLAVMENEKKARDLKSLLSKLIEKI
jgi:hypothetical protein